MQRHSGFTIIELLITMAIIAILASVALPSYTAYITRSKVAQATSNLLTMRTKMEQYFQDNRQYVGACVDGTVAALPPAWKSGDASGKLEYFDITCDIPAPLPHLYTVTATGKGDLNGMVLTIDQANLRKTTSVPTGWTLPSGNCWALKKSGDC